MQLLNSPRFVVKHICRSHQPTLKPKPAKELAFPNARQTEKMQQKLKKFNEKMNNETVTRGIFYCRDSAKMKGCGSLQTSSWFDSEVLRNRQQKHTAIRCTQFKE